MKVRQKNKQSVTLELDADEAARLLAALEDQARIVGEIGATLAEKLLATGVKRLKPEHVRTEYMPPLR